MIYKKIIAFLLSIITFLFTMNAYAQDKVQGAQYYYHSAALSGTDELLMIRSVVDTFNDYGYFIEAANLEQGIVTGWQFDYDSLPKATRFSGETNKNKIMQTIEVKVSDAENGQYNVDMRIIYKTKLVKNLTIYQDFLNQLKTNTNS